MVCLLWNVAAGLKVRLDDYNPLGGWGVLISVILYIYTKYAHIGVIINADVTVAHIYGNAIVPRHLILKRTFE